MTLRWDLGTDDEKDDGKNAAKGREESAYSRSKQLISEHHFKGMC